ncbi:hypothetical protein AB0N06_20535 [Streptomyces sp. NPDC051020]|uniref:hypothetical protein n=1 Tax=Streptomyces sp. NPDC051020 TaxID=3155409 RepID=UPI003446F38F
MTETATAGAAPTAVPGHFTINIPDPWWTLDLDPSTRDASIGRRVREQARGHDVDRELLDRLVRHGRKVAREAHGQGALRAAGMVAFLPDRSSIMATTVVLRVMPPEDGPADLAELLAPVALENDKIALGRGTEANRVETRELPELGTVGRVTRIEDVGFAGGSVVRMATMHTVIPVPGSRGSLVVSSATPNLSLTTAFFDVFDAIAGSVRFVS